MFASPFKHGGAFRWHSFNVSLGCLMYDIVPIFGAGSGYHGSFRATHVYVLSQPDGARRRVALSRKLLASLAMLTNLRQTGCRASGQDQR